LKLRGEVLASPDGAPLDTGVIDAMSRRLKPLMAKGLQFCVVIGAGNIFRGETSRQQEKNSITIERQTGDYMGMLATIINSLALKDVFVQNGIPAVVHTSIEMPRICETFVRENAVKALEAGKIVIFGGGTGNPFFTTDTTAALRAAEVGADLILKATKVDGVFDSDPKKNKDAKFFKTISFEEVLAKKLKVMDLAAISLCSDNNIPIIVFNFHDATALDEILLKNNLKGTLIGGTP